MNNSKKFDKPITTKIEALSPFYKAEEYHQDYAQKSSLRYNLYKKGSGREDFVEKSPLKEETKNILPNKSNMTKEEVLKTLTPIQYKVTQEKGTERPFDNPYWDNKEAGIYVDIIDGTPLYSSLDKYDSGTGWPSFTKPISLDSIVTNDDNTLFSTRTEVRSKKADSHLGHVFPDGPTDK